MVPERYTQPPAVAPNRTELVIDVDIPTHKFSKLDIVKLPVTRRLENITLHPDLAARLVPAEVITLLSSPSQEKQFSSLYHPAELLCV